ncbi:hypothetical protein F5888DRAFT_1806365 [Russula emetica]|nr:hypothetical protein F5888DRAFT_1806365 [Russula emetica]
MASTSTYDRVLVGWPSVSPHGLEPFRKAARPSNFAVLEEESTSIVSSGRAARTRGSFASVLEMMSTTLAVVPPLPFTDHAEEMSATAHYATANRLVAKQRELPEQRREN